MFGPAIRENHALIKSYRDYTSLKSYGVYASIYEDYASIKSHKGCTFKFYEGHPFL